MPRFLGRPLSRPQLVVLRNASVNAFITILMLLYLMLVSTLLEIFDCPEGEGGVPELRGEPTTECWSPKWWGYFPWSMLAALLYGAGIPIAFWAVLYLNRLNLFKELTIVKFGLMYRRYKVRYFLWELAILFRKLGIVVGVLLVTSGVTRAIIAFLVILISAGAHMRYQPYLSSRVNRLESIHLVCACVVLAAGPCEKGGFVGWPWCDFFFFWGGDGVVGCCVCIWAAGCVAMLYMANGGWLARMRANDVPPGPRHHL